MDNKQTRVFVDMERAVTEEAEASVPEPNVAAVQSSDSTEEKYAEVSTDNISRANEALLNTEHFNIYAGYSSYVSNNNTSAMLDREEAIKAISLGIHVVSINEFADYHGIHKGDYSVDRIMSVEDVNEYIKSRHQGREIKLSIDPAYEYGHIGNTAMSLSEMKLYVKSEMEKDKAHTHNGPTDQEPVKLKRPSFNEEQYRIARHESSALECAQQRGYPLVQKGRYYHHAEHTSMVFTQDGKWFWNSHGLSGGAIEMLQHVEGMSQVQAVLTLSGSRGATAPEGSNAQSGAAVQASEKTEARAEFKPPENGKNYRQLFGYLVAGRGLDCDIVKALTESGSIYPATHKYNDKILHNAVFAGRDENGVLRSAFIRGCNTGSSFKMEVEGSDKTYAFAIPGRASAEKLYVFEGAIDAVSHASIIKISGQDWQESHRISQGGNAPIETITRFLKAHPQVSAVELCMDSDDAGKMIAEKVKTGLAKSGWNGSVEITPAPSGKDWNEYLQTWRGVVKEYKNYPTTEYAGAGTQTTGSSVYGRIHHIDENGVIRKTVAYHDKTQFSKASQAFISQSASVIVETPEQIQLNHMNEPKKSAQATARVNSEVGMSMSV